MNDSVRYVDITPTWSQILPALLMLMGSDSGDARQIAGEELTRMARIADRYMSLQVNPAE